MISFFGDEMNFDESIILKSEWYVLHLTKTIKVF